MGKEKRESWNRTPRNTRASPGPEGCDPELAIETLRAQLLVRRHAIFTRVARVEDDLRWLGTDIESEAEERAQEENLSRLLARLDDCDKAEIEAIDSALRPLRSVR